MPVTREEIEEFLATEEGETFKEELGAPLKAVNVQLKAEKTALQEKHTTLKTSYDDLLANPKTVEVKVSDDTEVQKLIDAAVADVTGAADEKLTAAQTQLATMQRNAIGGTLSAEITKALQAQGGNVSLLDRHIAARCKAEIGEDGLVVITPLKANGETMYDENGVAPLSKLVAEFKSDKVYANAFTAKVPSGSGHQHKGGPGPGGAYDLHTGEGDLGKFLTRR